ncbi:hypothetical protein SAY86_002310 [Trapa natans]|uniref:S-protein homolog n=1 Tax=Trapa natans TaxID=22666 RepID=A0AAN7LFT4_TRANT|nr:hypothetical protein SAY86_002310 [Trapa natans]
MMHKNKITIFFLLMPFLLVGTAIHLGDLIHVSVWNKLPGGNNLSIHCKSKDNDLGLQTVRPNQDFAFHFYTNFLGTTLFYCRFKTKYGEGVYDIYNYKRDVDRCNECTWNVTQYGVFGYSHVSEVDFFWPKRP